MKTTPRTRDMMVRELTPVEAGRLLVHSHVITDERRRALLYWRGPADIYFTAEERAVIREWIKNEDYLPQESPVEHPKRQTFWCNYCGRVEEHKTENHPGGVVGRLDDAAAAKVLDLVKAAQKRVAKLKDLLDKLDPHQLTEDKVTAMQVQLPPLASLLEDLGDYTDEVDND